MKKLLTFFLFHIIVFTSYSQKVERLPEVPWANIAEMCMNQHSSISWESNIRVKLEGNYLPEDSILVAEIVETLDSITERISIGFSQRDRGNLEIFFMDSVNFSYEGYFLSYYSIRDEYLKRNPLSHAHFNQNFKTYSRIYIEKAEIDTIAYPNVLKNRIARNLVVGSLQFRESYQTAEDRNSIFNPVQKYLYEPLNELDRAIISEVYKPDFSNKLEIARKQFAPVIPWWLKVDPYQLLILPSGIILILLVLLCIRLFKRIDKKVRIDILNFNLKVLIVFILLGLLGNTYTFLAKYWDRSYPFDINYFHTYFHNLRAIYFIAAIVLFPGVNIIKYLEKVVYRKPKSKYMKLFVVFVTSSLVPYFIYIAFALIVSKINKQKVNEQAIEVFSIVFVVFFIIAIIRVLISYFIGKEKDLILENETKLSKLRELKSKAELNALHSRINPHFLYNSLNSIAGLAHISADKTEHMALSLSKLFRYSINKEKSDWTTFNEELEMVRIYLDVEKVRFDDRLAFSVDIDDNLKEQKIPRFIIQPLVENAVKHGISKSIEGGEIKISISKDKKAILIAVADSGKQFPLDLTPGFGIQSIYDKLEILYADKFEMSFVNSPTKQVILKLK